MNYDNKSILLIKSELNLNDMLIVLCTPVGEQDITWLRYLQSELSHGIFISSTLLISHYANEARIPYEDYELEYGSTIYKEHCLRLIKALSEHPVVVVEGYSDTYGARKTILGRKDKKTAIALHSTRVGGHYDIPNTAEGFSRVIDVCSLDADALVHNSNTHYFTKEELLILAQVELDADNV